MIEAHGQAVGSKGLSGRRLEKPGKKRRARADGFLVRLCPDVPPTMTADGRNDETPARWSILPRSVLRLLPAITASALFAHLAWFGLRPALAERERLSAAAAEVQHRHASEEATHGALQDLDTALDDELYRERVRRMFARERSAQREERAARNEEVVRDPSWFGSEGEFERLSTRDRSRPSRGNSNTGGSARPAGSLVR